MNRLVPFLFIMLAISVPAFTTEPPIQQQKTLTLIFQHKVGDQPLCLDSALTNIFGETMIIERFRYYLSNFSITDPQGKTTVLPVRYFLVDESDSPSKKIVLSIPDMAVSTIHFLVGVDSIRNVSGIQTGALDPAKGMFWTWNTGYVMAKLEGRADVSVSPGHRFTYHIGGFRTGMNTTRMIHLDITDRQKQSSPELTVTVDINRWFKGKTDLRIAATPVCHSPGELAMRIADNYSSSFSIHTREN